MRTDKDKIVAVLDFFSDIFSEPMYKRAQNTIICQDKTYIFNQAGEIVKITIGGVNGF